MSASLSRGGHSLDEKEEGETQHRVSMAAKASSVEDDLKNLLEEEAKRRHEFSVSLLSLLSRHRRERREKETGGDEATVPDLVKRVEDADVVATSLLQECQSLCLEEVNKREKGTNDFSSSPFSPLLFFFLLLLLLMMFSLPAVVIFAVLMNVFFSFSVLLLSELSSSLLKMFLFWCFVPLPRPPRHIPPLPLPVFILT